MRNQFFTHDKKSCVQMDLWQYFPVLLAFCLCIGLSPAAQAQVLSATVTDLSCNPAPCPMGDGAIDLTITGGTPPYLIDWELNNENLVPPCTNDANFSNLSGINADATAGPVAAAVNAENYTIQGATLTLSVPVVNGGATIDENQINDTHLNGTVAVRTGVLHDGLPPGANGANVTRTWSFSSPVCNLTMFVNDMDRNDEIIINGSLNGGAPIALTPTDFYYPNPSPCHSYTATNTWTSDVCNPPFDNLSNSNQGGMYIVFPGCIDEIEIIFYDFSSGTEGGSYSVNFPDSCPEDLTCLEDGTYEVAVTDATGTTVTASYEVQAIVCGECTITAVVDQILCDETTGDIDITVSDCLPPYSYYWEDENGNPLDIPQPCTEEDWANFQSLNGTGANPVIGADNLVVENAINNANYSIQGAIMTVNQLVFGGGGSIDEEIINDSQLNGTFALRTGVDHEGIAGGYPGGAYMLRTFTFDRPVCDLEMFFNDIDNNDVAIINPKLNGVIIPVTPADYTFIGANVADVGNNQFESINDSGLNNTDVGGIDFTFTSCVDEIELIFYDDVAGPGVTDSEGGSYSVNFPPICGHPEDQTDLPPGCYTVYVTDESGGETSAEYCLEVTDVEDPQITCPDHITVNTDPGSCTAVVSWIPPVPTDDCPGVMITTSSFNPGDAFPVGTTTVTYTATDGEGNTATCSFDITVIDNEDPEIFCPGNITVSTDAGACSAVVTWAPPPPSATDNCPDVLITSSTHDPGDTFPIGMTTVTYTATDDFGNTATCSFTITVEDNEDPRVTCPADITVPAATGSCEATATWTLPIPEDNCPGVTINGSHEPGDVFPVGSTTVTYIIVDAAGNASNCTFVVTVTDNEAPPLTCPADITTNTDAGVCEAVVTWTPPVPQGGSCLGGSVTLTSTHDPGDVFPVGMTTVTYTATDDANNVATCSFSVTVEDNEDPVWNCPANITVSTDAGLCSADVNWAVPTATDNCGVTSSNSNFNPGDTFPAGTTTVTYVAVDAAGNSVSCSFDVIVVDSEDPILTCPAEIRVSTDADACEAVVTWSEPSLADNCSATITGNSHNSGDTFPLGTTTVTYTAADASGNTATCTFDVVVEDTEDPVLTCPADITVSADPGACSAVITAATLPVPVATDNCPLVTTTSTHNPGDSFPVGATTVTWTATDAAGNVVTCTFDVIVEDNEAPVLTCPTDILVSTDANTCDAVATWTAPTLTDNCTATVTNASHNSGDVFPTGTTTVTYTAADAAGNTVTCTFDVVVEDNEDLVLTCPTDITVSADAGLCTTRVTWTAPTLTDNCGATITGSSHNSGDIFPLGTTTVTYTAADGAGNTATCSFDIIVEDTENPVLTCPADITVETVPGQCEVTATWTAPAVTDNCAGATITGSSHNSGDTFPIGITTVTYTATDAAGNMVSCTFDVVVNECEGSTPVTQTETVSLLSDQDTNVGASDTESFAANGTYTFTDPGIPVNAVLFNITLELFFRVDGASCESDIEIQLTDPAGNVNVFTPFATCIGSGPLYNIVLNVPNGALSGNTSDWLVEFRDTNDQNAGSREYSVRAGILTYDAAWTTTSGGCADPVIVNCPADVNVVMGLGVCGANVIVPEPMYGTDFTDCANATITNSFTGTSDGSGFYPEGETVVTWTVTDAQGNTATCTQTITVEDTQGPVLTCPADVMAETTPGNCDAMATWTLPTVSDNCEATITGSSHTPGDVFPIGTTTVTYTAMDAAGNTTSCSFNVVVGECTGSTTSSETITLASDQDTDVGINDTESFASNGTYTFTDPATPANAVLSNITLELYFRIDGASCESDIEVRLIDPAGNANVFTPFTTCTGSGPLYNIVLNVPGGTTTGSVADWVAEFRDTNDQNAGGREYSVRYGRLIYDATVTASGGCADPVIVNCPADINLSAEPGICGAQVNIPTPVFGTDFTDCTGAIITNSFNGTSNASGFYPVGTMAVTWTAIDNQGNTATCTQMITVTDDEDPIITCQGDRLETTDAGQCGAVVFWNQPTVSDNCGATLSSSHSSGDTFPVGTTIITYTATDAAGNTAICTFRVIVADDEDPFISCPADIEVSADAGSCGAFINLLTPSPADNCPGVTSTTTHDSGDLFPVGTTVVTYTATDAAGNTAMCTFNVTVIDDEIPAIDCPADIIVSNEPGECYATVMWTPPTVSDNCGVLTSNYGPGDLFAVGTTTVEYTVFDGAGNSTICSFDVTVEDTENPMVVCPADITVNNDAGECGAVVNWAPPVPTDNCSAAVSGSSHNPGDVFPVGTTTVSYTVTDDAGNEATCSFDVIVEDNEDPMITCPNPILVSTNPGQCSATISLPTPGATDNCPGVMVMSSNPTMNTFPIGTTTVTYTATDAAGNTATCTLDIIVIDNEDPAITCPADIVATTDPGQCHATVSWQIPIPTDNCGVTSASGSDEPGSIFPIGITTVQYIVIDVAGNQAVCSFNITVEDNEHPTVTCPADIVVSADADQCTAIVNWVPPTPTDNCSASINNSSHDPGDTFPLGTTTVTYVVVDAEGNTAMCSFNVIVEDTQDPVITCPADIIVSATPGECGAIVTLTLPAAMDNCPGAISTTTHNSGSFFPVGTTTVTWTATDITGNITTCTFDVIVEDNEDPVITCPADIIVSNDPGECFALVSWTEPAVTDDCGVANVFATDMPGSIFPVGTTTVEYTAIDNSGNITICSFDITVTDTEDPVVVCPADIIVTNDAGECGAIINFTAPVPTDNCSATVISNSHNPGDFFPVGSTTVTYTIEDAAGNTATCSFDVSVEDNEDPVLTCPADIVVSANSATCEAEVSWAAVTVADNCSASIQGSTHSPGGLFPLGTTEVEYQAIDIYGNSSTCSFFVTVEDNTPPVIVNCPADLIVAGPPGECEGPVIVPVPVFGVDYTDCQSGTVMTNDYNGTGSASGIYPVGTTTVMWTATDLSGNSVSCEQTITVTPTDLMEDIELITDKDVFVGGLNTESYLDNDSILIADPGIPANSTVGTVILEFFFRPEYSSCESDVEMELTDPSGNITIFTAPVTTCNGTDQLFQFLLPAASVPTAASGGGNWKLRFRDIDDQNQTLGNDPVNGQLLSTEYSVRYGRLIYEVTTTPDCPDGFAPDDNGADNDAAMVDEIVIEDTAEENNSPVQIENNMNIYPVPTYSVLNIEYMSDTEIRGDIVVVDANGAQMLAQEVYIYEGNNRFEMDVTSLVAGVYYLRIMRADGVITVKPFTKITP